MKGTNMKIIRNFKAYRPNGELHSPVHSLWAQTSLFRVNGNSITGSTDTIWSRMPIPKKSEPTEAQLQLLAKFGGRQTRPQQRCFERAAYERHPYTDDPTY